MRWAVALTLAWWYGALATPLATPTAPPAPPPSPSTNQEWQCPEIKSPPAADCDCDMPHTLRCSGNSSALDVIGKSLRTLPPTASVSLLDCTVQNVTSLGPRPLLQGVSLHGLVVSSGELTEVRPGAFGGLAQPLQALGLPNNRLESVPTEALRALPELDRLDLSGNRMERLDGGAFKGLRNLSFIDLSNNLLSKISPDTFDDIPQLKILRLRGNRINLNTITKLNPLPTIEELDISENNLVGPLSPKTFPEMESLRDLQLSHNSLSSIKNGALQRLTNLTSLWLQHNQIDVIEDHAFSHLSGLVSLDLAYNRIVAVSGNSLAHLNMLEELDLRHNFLRALTADLIQPLTNLKVLRLDDNDISIVASDALKPNTVISSLTLSENPLNCDCSLSEFASWLMNSSLSKENKSSVVCTTPPSLENGLLVEVPLDQLLCGEDEAAMVPLAAPYKTKINLKSYKYEENVELEWNVDDDVIPYYCDAIFIYEEKGLNEVLMESSPLQCNSTDLLDPTTLHVTIPNSIQLLYDHKYRYCVVLMGASDHNDDVSLVLGCSEIIPLIQKTTYVTPKQVQYTSPLPRVIAVQANLTGFGTLSVDISMYPSVNRCDLNVAILDQSTLLSQRKVNCSEPKYTFVGLNRGPYRVCANIVKPPGAEVVKPRCVTVYRRESHGFTSLDIAFVSIFVFLCVLVIALIWGVRKILLKPKLQTHQCFLPPECDDQVQHNRYVKLQATTKL